MSNALPLPEGNVFVLSEKHLVEGKSASRKSARLRVMMPIQRSSQAKVQRLLNFLQPGTYVRPHRHPLPHATESVCLLEGHLEVIIFSPEGQMTGRHHLSPRSPLIDLEPNTWHGMIIHDPDTVIFETKQGPYDPMTDKEFAPWSPEEDSPDAAPFLNSLGQTQ